METFLTSLTFLGVQREAYLGYHDTGSTYAEKLKASIFDPIKINECSLHRGSDSNRWFLQRLSFGIVDCGKTKGGSSGRYNLFKPIFTFTPLRCGIVKEWED